MFFYNRKVLIIILYIISNQYLIVSLYAGNNIYEHINQIPSNKVGVILGTSKYYVNTNNNKKLNPYFICRINAICSLFNANKIKYIIISGNKERNYNEPQLISRELLKNGIPSQNIHKDYFGFRTFDSIIRICKIFKQKKFTVVSQKFHNERAIFIAYNFLRLNEVVGFNAKTPFFCLQRIYFREFCARFRMIYDYYVLFLMTKSHNYFLAIILLFI